MMTIVDPTPRWFESEQLFDTLTITVFCFQQILDATLVA